MAQVSFSTVEQGYSPYEVDHYIEMLQQEYKNSVGWSEQLDSRNKGMEMEIEKNKAVLAELKSKNEQLLKDCRALAVKLNDFSTGKVRVEDLYNERDRLRTENEYLKAQLHVGGRNADDVVGKLFNDMMDSIEKQKRDANLKATESVAKANERASAIIKNANQKSVEINAKNDIILKSLGNLYDVIGEVLDELESK